MGISPFELNATVTRSQDFSVMKQHEDNRGLVNHHNIQHNFQEETTERMQQVRQGENAQGKDTQYSANEKGNGHYEGDGGRKRKKSEKLFDGNVVQKSSGNFDIKI